MRSTITGAAPGTGAGTTRSGLGGVATAAPDCAQAAEAKPIMTLTGTTRRQADIALLLLAQLRRGLAG
jgi:hypothetical protein